MSYTKKRAERLASGQCVLCGRIKLGDELAHRYCALCREKKRLDYHKRCASRRDSARVMAEIAKTSASIEILQQEIEKCLTCVWANIVASSTEQKNGYIRIFCPQLTCVKTGEEYHAYTEEVYF